MSKDIRSYFSSNSTKGNASGHKDKHPNSFGSSHRKYKRTFLDSDSEDEVTAANSTISGTAAKKQKLNNKKTKVGEDNLIDKNGIASNNKKRRKRNIALSSSSDENDPLPIPEKKVQKKLANVATTSRHFKQVNAADVFGTEPVKRSRPTLPDALKTVKSKSVEQKDAEFKELELQADKVGDNWTAMCNDDPIDALLLQSDIIGDDWIPEAANKIETSTKVSSKKNKTSAKANKTKNNESLKGPSDSQDSGIGADTSVLDLKGDTKSNFATDSSDADSLLSTPTEIQPKFVDSIKNSISSKIFFHETILEKDNKSRSSKHQFQTSTPLLVDNKESVSDSIQNSTSSKKFHNKPIPKEVNKFKSMNKIQNSTPVLDIKEPAISIDETLLWVEKHKPQSSNKIIGQQGDKSNVKKLINWLKDWDKNNPPHKKTGYAPGGWGKDPTGALFKAAMLCGPPGVGKTTSVNLVCKELGYDVVEFNASDTRSKRLLQEDVSEMLNNTSLTPYFRLSDKSKTSLSNKRVLVMDEVDGMAGNEDRGGIPELINLIKCSRIPVICMCNDRTSPKIRSLLNYCFELRYSRPRVEQIKGYMMSVCYKEKLNIPPQVLTDLIISTNNDVRLTLNHLSMLAADKSNTNLDSEKKNVKVGPWDALRKIFSREDHKNMTIHDKCELFFHDYSLTPLFVYENYLSVKPLSDAAHDKQKKMELFASAANSICMGDQIESCIRKTNNWSLLPVQAVFSSYIPGELLEGYCTSQINFPSWFGQNSKQGRMGRLLQELQMHTRLRISGSKLALKLDYAPHIRNAIVEPLLKDGTIGVNSALDKLRTYNLLRDDLDNLNEISSWSTSVNPLTKLDSKVKSAFTRAYNKETPMCPYALSAPIKKIKTSVDIEGLDEDEEVEEIDEDIDAMIIERKKKPGKKVEDSSDIASSSMSKQNATSKKTTNRKKGK